MTVSIYSRWHSLNPYWYSSVHSWSSGSKAMAASADVGQILTKHYQNGNIVAAICAGPRALLAHKIGAEHQHTITCYPSVRKEFTEGEPYKLDTPDHAVCHSKFTEKGTASREMLWLNSISSVDLGTSEKEYHLVTSQGPATSMVFALKLIELLKGRDEATKIKEGLLA